MSENNYQELINRADNLFMHEQYEEAAAKYQEALQAAPSDQHDYINGQIQSIKAITKPPELAPETKSWVERNMGGLDMGKQMSGMLIKGFLPKIKPLIEKNKPKAIAFMKGEINFKGEETPPDKAVPRIIVIENYIDPSGDPSKNDVMVQILRAPYVRVQTAKDDDGKDMALEEIHSVTNFLSDIMNTNMEEALKQAEEGGFSL